MEYLRDANINGVDSENHHAEAEEESRLGDPALELETPETWAQAWIPEAWPENQDKNNKETSGKRLMWLHVIGENIMKYF